MKPRRCFIPCVLLECCRDHDIDLRIIGCRVLICTFIAILMTVSITHAADSSSPLQTVQSTVTELFSIVKGEAEPYRWNQRRRDVEQVIRRHVSYYEMAQRSLGEAWTRLDDSQREEFVDLFVQILRDALANRLFEYSDEQVVYLSEEHDQGCANVATKLWGDKVDTSVEFRLKKYSGRWMLYDAVIDGTSIISNYRAQFTAVIRDVSYAGLVHKMKQRTLMVKMFEGTGS